MADPYQPHVDAIEATMRDLLRPPWPEVEPLYGMMRYHLGWADQRFRPLRAPAGKRVRPLICLLACQATGGEWRAALPLAAGLELVHNFSLIHDDVEDSSPTRRHRPTVWATWGVPQAVNTGDAMFALARLAVHRLAGTGIQAQVILAVLQRVEETCLALCEGQHLDLAFEAEPQVSLEGYLRMIEGKTAALLACAAQTGALVGGGLGGPHEELGRFGRELGLAFQIVDDILGVWGDPALTGKPAADDLRHRKKTFPVLHALVVLAARGDRRLAGLLAQDALSDDDVAAAVACLVEAGARERAQERATEHTERALTALTRALPPSPARDSLHELALRLVARET